MYYVTGGGKEVNGGVWEVTATPKTVTFECVTQPLAFKSDMPDKVRLNRVGRNKHFLKEWEDGSYTVYPFKNGTPHVFNPLSNKKGEQ